MVEVAMLKKEAKKVENENYKFRIYLKNHANSNKLDKQFKELHKELFKDYDCQKCRNCCRTYAITFEEDEIQYSAKLLNMNEEQFRDKYITRTYNGYEVKQSPCLFLKDDGICIIEKCKPQGCREYPFTNIPQRLFSLGSIVDSASICPVVFEILERLKKIYGFSV